YNCNEFGHKSQDCQQPKCEKNTCFNCGKADHLIKDCPQKFKKSVSKGKPRETEKSTEEKVKQIGLVEEQVYRDLRYKFESGEVSLELTLRTLLDSGSPISFVKESFIPTRLITQMNGETNKYSGLNGSPLRCVDHGKVCATVEFDSEIINRLFLRVVPDSSMKALVVIGRDAWNRLGLTVSREKSVSTKQDVEKRVDENSEENACKLLKISASIFSVDEVDALKINEKIAPE
ncbi:Cellular nucleic acid-binding protein like protein, partial [Cyphomyrmex costatus]